MRHGAIQIMKVLSAAFLPNWPIPLIAPRIAHLIIMKSLFELAGDRTNKGSYKGGRNRNT